jgi:hypothetical protein
MEYSLLTRLVAKEQKVALYDYFNITGGLHSMLNWSKDGLSNKDQCHLSGTGYRFKGELLFNGIMNGYLTFLNGKKENNLVFEVNQDIDTCCEFMESLNYETIYTKSKRVFLWAPKAGHNAPADNSQFGRYLGPGPYAARFGG